MALLKLQICFIVFFFFSLGSSYVKKGLERLMGFFFSSAKGWAVFLGFRINGSGKGRFQYLVGGCSGFRGGLRVEWLG